MWAYPWRSAKKANKAKVPSDNHAKPSRKNKKTEKGYSGECRWEPTIWRFRMRFSFFCSGDDVGPTMPSPSCQTDILFKIRHEDIITRAKKTKSHAEAPNCGLPPAFS